MCIWNKKKSDILNGAEMINIALEVKKAIENLGYKVEFKITARGLKIKVKRRDDE